MYLAHLRRVEEARTLVEPLLDDIDGLGDDELPDGSLVVLLQATVALKHPAAAKALAARLACVAHLSNVGTTINTCVGRHLGDAAVLVGDRTAARAYYAQALDAAGKIRFRPELALTHLALAELLLEEKNGSARFEAQEHLDIAIPELRAMQMQPDLEHALALNGKHASATAHAQAHQLASNTLTTREREIASLIADGLSNHAMAERLVITNTTVEVHVKHILSKLGFRSRSQVAALFAHRQSEAPSDDRA